jgi:hypothetical protein
MENKISDNTKVTGRLTMILKNVKTGRVRKYVYKNMVVTYGKNAIAQRLAGQSVGEITYCSLGTGSTAPALGDTALETELIRKLISVRGYENNVATFQTYFTTSEGNGTLREAGLFGNGVGRTASTTPGSGQLFCRVAINRSKTSNDTLTLYWDVTIG